jgi:hypothetical protein
MYSTLLHFPAKDESGDNAYVSVIDTMDLAKRMYTPARMYAIHTLCLQTESGGKFEKKTYEEGEKGRPSYNTSRLSYVMNDYESLCQDDKLFWETKSREQLAHQPVVRQEIIDDMRKDPKRSWESLESDIINYWCSNHTLHWWVQSREGYHLYAE